MRGEVIDGTAHGGYPPPLQAGDCLFLDFDGTLLELQDHPGRVQVDAGLRSLLRGCAGRLGGALAIISGRPLQRLDAQFAPDVFATAGLHGLERRSPGGATILADTPAAPLRAAVRHLSLDMEALPMAILEDKGNSVALHWRTAPENEPALRDLARRELRRAGTGFRLLEGNCVIELLPEVASKGDAVRAFMSEPPFRGRRPVFIGDDITDADGITAAREFGGYGIAVGTRIAGDFRLADALAVRAWLAEHDNA